MTPLILFLLVTVSHAFTTTPTTTTFLTNQIIPQSSLPSAAIPPSLAIDVITTTTAQQHEPSSFLLSSSSLTTAAEGIDPGTVVGQALGALVTSPAIIAVPILAGLAVTSLVAFFIVSYANPADPDE